MIEEVRQGDGDVRLVTSQSGAGRYVSPRRVLRQLEKRYGKRHSRRLRKKRLDFRIVGPDVVVYEECPIMLTHLAHGVGVLTRVSLPITAIKPDWGIHDFWRSRKRFVGESVMAGIEKMDAKVNAEKQWRLDDIKQAALDDAKAMEKGRQQFGPGSYRG